MPVSDRTLSKTPCGTGSKSSLSLIRRPASLSRDSWSLWACICSSCASPQKARYFGQWQTAKLEPRLGYTRATTPVFAQNLHRSHENSTRPSWPSYTYPVSFSRLSPSSLTASVGYPLSFVHGPRPVLRSSSGAVSAAGYETWFRP